MAMNGYSFIKKVSKLPTPNPTATVVVRRSVFDKVGMFNEKLIIATDTDMWIRIATLDNFAYRDEVQAHIRRDGHNISSTPEEDGNKALFKHELSRIDMFKHILNETKLTPTEKAVLKYRIAELHFQVDEIALRLGQKTPFDISKIKLPPKPKELQEIDALMGKTLASRVNKILKKLLGRNPKLYNRVRKTIKRALKPLRR
jgi:hypothetical protein